MLILIAVLLALVPAIVILYPFLHRLQRAEPLQDESSPGTELERRWDSAVAGLRNAELERAIGSLSSEDHEWLRQQYMTEAALVMKAMELEEQQELDLLASIDIELQRAREQVLGVGGTGPPLLECPDCSSPVSEAADTCPDCGRPLDAQVDGRAEADPKSEAVGD